MDNVKAYLSDIRKNESFHSYYQVTVAVVGEPSSQSDKTHNYNQLYFEVIDNTLTMLDDRFDSGREFAFLDLINPIFHLWQEEVSRDKLQLLNAKYGTLFDISLLEHQLHFMYSDGDFCQVLQQNCCSTRITHNNLHPSLSEVVKLLKLNGAIAILSVSFERSFSCLKRVQKSK